MTSQPGAGYGPQQPYGQPPAQAKKKVRVFTWIIVAINVLFLAWLVFGIAGVSNSSCDNLSAKNCEAAKAIGGGIGAVLIIFLWVAVDVILGIIWLVTRKKEPTIVYMAPPPQYQQQPPTQPPYQA